jgi:nucleotide-binding universal stress UspA family protein
LSLSSIAGFGERHADTTHEETNMLRILIPVLDSTNALPAARHVVREAIGGEKFEVHLLHVTPPLSAEIARWFAGSESSPSRSDTADRILRPVERLLGSAHIPHTTHLEVGDEAPVIVAMSWRLSVDRIVLGAARERSLTRFVEDLVIEKVIDFSPVPVDLVVGKSVAPLERFGVPTGIAAALGLLWLRMVD